MPPSDAWEPEPEAVVGDSLVDAGSLLSSEDVVGVADFDVVPGPAEIDVVSGLLMNTP